MENLIKYCRIHNFSQQNSKAVDGKEIRSGQKLNKIGIIRKRITTQEGWFAEKINKIKDPLSKPTQTERSQ